MLEGCAVHPLQKVRCMSAKPARVVTAGRGLGCLARACDPSPSKDHMSTVRKMLNCFSKVLLLRERHSNAHGGPRASQAQESWTTQEGGQRER